MALQRVTRQVLDERLRYFLPPTTDRLQDGSSGDTICSGDNPVFSTT